MATSTVAGITIEGGNAFITRTTEALLLLVRSSPAFSEVRPYLGRIEEARRSGMRAYDTPPTYDVGEATSTSNVIWYASTIAHDSHHSRLYHQAALRNSRVPDETWTGAAAEAACNRFQIRVLQELRSVNPSLVDSYIQYLQGLLRDAPDYYSDYRSRSW